MDLRLRPAAIEEMSQSFEAGGTIRARTTAAAVSRLMGEVREVRVEPGQRVRRGQVLVVLDDRDLAAARERAGASARAASQGIAAAAADRESADAGLALARATHERISTLRARNSATAHELDEAMAGLRAADARLRGAEAKAVEAAARLDAANAARIAADVTASFATLVAPFDGLVTRTLVEPGNMATPGMPLVTVEDTAGYRLDVQIDESRAALIVEGASAGVEVDAGVDAPASGSPRVSLSGRVAEIARAVDPGGHAFLVKIDLPAGAPVRSGMFGRARFTGPARRVLVVPAPSIVRRGQLTLVFVADAQGRARMRAVRLGELAGENVEVVAGLDAGEHVVLEPPTSLVDGVLIRGAKGQSSAAAVPRHLLKPVSLRMTQVLALEAVLVAAAPRPPSHEGSLSGPASPLLGGLTRSFVTSRLGERR